ncbi:MAG: hypothetical protein QOE22_579 [Candidatus Parcubacteria bacterium]|jgi:endonuclease/exonuclease/phosphatase family metal-dependent hydrolase|nr:hypothetical protein [Candidatus Parcubacteria bacterium]
MKILTINTAFGFTGMDRFATNLKRHLHMHGWGVLTYEFFPFLRGRSSRISKGKRIAYVKKHQYLDPYLELIQRIAPDILILNEALYELYHERIERELRAMGFQTIAWGLSEHYPGTTISIVVATKEPGEIIPCSMPQRPSMGGGAGMAGIRLKARPLTIFGVHLTYRNPAMFVKQLAYIAEMTTKERALGNEAVLAGDWNENETALYANPSFRLLGLVSADPDEKLTCPVFLPRFLQRALDHIFISPHWTRVHAETVASGSDHLALSVEVEPQSTTTA